MPPITGVTINVNGITIHTTYVGDIDMSMGQLRSLFNKNTSLDDASANATEEIQSYFETHTLLSTLEPDDRALEDPPDLSPYERIERISGKWTFISTWMYVAVRIFSTQDADWLSEPYPLTICCSDSPIGGEWWL